MSEEAVASLCVKPTADGKGYGVFAIDLVPTGARIYTPIDVCILLVLLNNNQKKCQNI